MGWFFPFLVSSKNESLTRVAPLRSACHVFSDCVRGFLGFTFGCAWKGVLSFCVFYLACSVKPFVAMVKGGEKAASVLARVVPMPLQMFATLIQMD